MYFFQGLYNAMAGSCICGGLTGLVAIHVLPIGKLAQRLHLGEVFIGLFVFGSVLLLAAAITAFRLTWGDRGSTPLS